MANYNLVVGKLANKISRLADNAIAEIGSLDPVRLDEYVQFIQKEPVARSCVELKALRASISIGEYEHEDKRIQEFIREMFENISGSFPKIIGQMSSAMALGFSCAELEFGLVKKQWVIKSIIKLDQRRTTFRGCKGRIEEVMYVDNIKKSIPYYKVIHVANGYATDTDDPYGIPEAKAALPFIKAKHSLLADMVVAGKNLSTGILIGKVNSNKPTTIYNPDGTEAKYTNGRPLSSADALYKQFQNIENNSFLVTDKENDITLLQIGDGQQFWLNGLNTFDKYIMRSFSVPDLVFSENASILTGSASLSNKQTNIMDSTISAVVQQIQDQLIEKGIKQIILANFGVQKNYGKFSTQPFIDPNLEMSILGQIMSAMSMGIIPNNDIDAINRIRSIMKLPKINVEEQMKQAQMDQMMANPSNPDPSQDPNTQYP